MKRAVSLFLMVAVFAGMAAAQSTSTKPPSQPQAQPGAAANNVCMVYFIMPKPGAEAQFEESVKQHMQWHRQQNDDWEWSVSQTMVGELGSYVAASCGHSWSDFDTAAKKMEADEQNAMQTMGPHIAKVTNSFYVLRTDLSSPPPAPNAEPMPYSSVLVFQLKPGQAQAFAEAIKKVQAAVGSGTAAPNIYWAQMASGGEAPTFVLIRELKGFSDFGSDTMMQRLVAAVGAEQAAQLMNAVSDKVKAVYTSMDRARPDLSYRPAAAKPR